MQVPILKNEGWALFIAIRIAIIAIQTTIAAARKTRSRNRSTARLGYEIAKNKMMQIVAGNTPVFHKVADAITQLAIKGTYRSTENYIVTSDRVIYRVAQDTANPDNHNIVRV